MSHALRIAVLVLLALCPPAVARAQEMTLSVAISMKEAVETLGRQFMQSRSGVTLHYNFGSSGELQKQIEAGAPVDVFISAAQRQMDELEQKGLINAASRRVFARNVLTVIKPAGSTLDIAKPADLLGPKVQRIVIGNPKTVPVGQYAEESLKSLGLWNQVQPKLVLSENVRQALDYVARGEVDGRVRLHDGRGAPLRPGRRSVSTGRGHLSAGDVSGGRGEGLEAADARPGVHRSAGEPRRASGALSPRLSASAARRALIDAPLLTGGAAGTVDGEASQRRVRQSRASAGDRPRRGARGVGRARRYPSTSGRSVRLRRRSDCGLRPAARARDDRSR